jgi:mercuric ion transport protein
MEVRSSLIAGVLAGIGASLCCAAPLVLLTLGIGGAWVSTLTKVEPLRPVFIALTLGFLAVAHRRLYRTDRKCEVGAPCADDKVVRRQRFIFWLVALPVLALLALPWLAPFLV